MANITFDKDGGTKEYSYSLKKGCENVSISTVVSSDATSWLSASVDSTNKKIKITASAFSTSGSRTGKVTPKVGDDTCDTWAFNVSQTGGEAPVTCECTALTVQETASVLVGKTANVPFTANCTTGHSVSSSDGSIATATINGTNIAITGVKAGTATVTLTYDGDETHKNCTKTITVTVISDCDCDKLTINGRTDAIPAAGGENIQIGTYNSDTCLVSLGGTSDKDWVTNIKLENGKITANIAEYTDTTKDRTANITITGKTATTATDTCTKDAFEITQSQSATTCECSALTLSTTSITVNVGTSTTVSFTADCTTDHSVSSSDETVATATTGTSGTDKILTITGKKAGTATITLTYTAGSKTDCTKTIDVEVECGTIAITPKDSSGECTGGEVTFNATYTP